MATRKRRRPRDASPSPRTASAGAAPHNAGATQPAGRLRPDWRWRSFPTFFAFVCGMLLAFLVNEGTANPVAFILLIGSLLGVGYGLAHMFITNLVVANRVRARRRATLECGESIADGGAEYEEVLVYDDDSDSGADDDGAPPAASNAP